jgi:hypothetical protein
MVIREWMKKCFKVELPKLDLEASGGSKKVKAWDLGVDGVSFTDPRSFDIPPDSVSLKDGDFRTQEAGWDGTTYRMGRAYRGDNHEKDVPVVWRGLRMDYGLAHRVFLGSTVYQRGVFDIMNVLRSLDFRVDPADVEPENEPAAEMQAFAVQDAIENLEGGWDQFVGEAVYSLAVPGFGIWQRIHHEDGRLRRLAFRRPNALNGILFDEDEQRIIAFEFVDSVGGTYTIDVQDILLLSYMGLGLDVEGLSPWRAASEYELAKQALIDIVMVSAVKMGAPRDVVEVSPGVILSEDDKTEIGNALDDHRGDQVVNLVLPPGAKVASLRPHGPYADFLPILRYFDEQIGLPLSMEGALFTGTSGAGSYAALEVKDRQKLSTAGAFLFVMISGLSGATGQGYHGPIRVMIDAMGGPIEGRYPQLAIAVDEEDASLTDIALAAEKGLIVVNLEVQRAIHRKLNLPEPDDSATTEVIQPSALPGVTLSDSPVAHFATSGGWCSVPGCGCKMSEAKNLRWNLEAAISGTYALSDRPNLFRAPLSTEEIKALFTATNKKIATAFEVIGQEFRRAWAERTQGLGFAELIPVRDEFRSVYLPQFREAAFAPMGELYRQGELSIVAEMGILKKVPKGAALIPAANEAVLGMADALALKSYNITEHHLFERGRLEANGLPERKLPPIPESTAYVSQVSAMTAPAFTIGRAEAVQVLFDVAVARAPAGKNPKIIAEYSSVMEENTCESCAALDGLRVFVGSAEYDRIKPPSVCEGGERCRCIFTYIADEQDFEDIYNEVDAGFSQARGFELSDMKKGST